MGICLNKYRLISLLEKPQHPRIQSVHYIQLDRKVGFLHIAGQGDSYRIQIKKEAGFIVYC